MKGSDKSILPISSAISFNCKLKPPNVSLNFLSNIITSCALNSDKPPIKNNSTNRSIRGRMSKIAKEKQGENE